MRVVDVMEGDVIAKMAAYQQICGRAIHESAVALSPGIVRGKRCFAPTGGMDRIVGAKHFLPRLFLVVAAQVANHRLQRAIEQQAVV
jgi:hypothetical protein